MFFPECRGQSPVIKGLIRELLDLDSGLEQLGQDGSSEGQLLARQVALRRIERIEEGMKNFRRSLEMPQG